MNYLESRKKFAEKCGFPTLFDYIDHWQIYVGKENLSRFLTIYETLKEISNVKGDIIELGSWKGANLLGIAKILSFLTQDYPRTIYSFDSFEGLTKPSKSDDFDESLRGKYKGDFNQLTEAIELYDLGNLIKLIPGMIEETVPNFALQNKSSVYSLIYYDADFYEPAKVMFENLAPMLSVGGVILMDEYGSPSWPGETKATDEFLSNNKNFLKGEISSSKQPTLRIKRIS